MTTPGSRAALLVLILAALPLAGCTTALKQAYHEVRGADSEIHTNNVVIGRPLADCGRVDFKPAYTDLSGRLCPPTLISAYDRMAGEAERELETVYAGDGPTLNVETEVLFFERKGILGTAQFLSRVRMVSEGVLLIDAWVDTRSKSFRAGAEDDLAESTVKELAQFLYDQKVPPAE